MFDPQNSSSDQFIFLTQDLNYKNTIQQQSDSFNEIIKSYATNDIQQKKGNKKLGIEILYDDKNFSYNQLGKNLMLGVDKNKNFIIDQNQTNFTQVFADIYYNKKVKMWILKLKMDSPHFFLNLTTPKDYKAENSKKDFSSNSSSVRESSVAKPPNQIKNIIHQLKCSPKPNTMAYVQKQPEDNIQSSQSVTSEQKIQIAQKNFEMKTSTLYEKEIPEISHLDFKISNYNNFQNHHGKLIQSEHIENKQNDNQNFLSQEKQHSVQILQQNSEPVDQKNNNEQIQFESDIESESNNQKKFQKNVQKNLINLDEKSLEIQNLEEEFNLHILQLQQQEDCIKEQQKLNDENIIQIKNQSQQIQNLNAQVLELQDKCQQQEGQIKKKQSEVVLENKNLQIQLENLQIQLSQNSENQKKQEEQIKQHYEQVLQKKNDQGQNQNQQDELQKILQDIKDKLEKSENKNKELTQSLKDFQKELQQILSNQQNINKNQENQGDNKQQEINEQKKNMQYSQQSQNSQVNNSQTLKNENSQEILNLKKETQQQLNQLSETLQCQNKSLQKNQNLTNSINNNQTQFYLQQPQQLQQQLLNLSQQKQFLNQNSIQGSGFKNNSTVYSRFLHSTTNNSPNREVYHVNSSPPNQTIGQQMSLQQIQQQSAQQFPSFSQNHRKTAVNNQNLQKSNQNQDIQNNLPQTKQIIIKNKARGISVQPSNSQSNSPDQQQRGLQQLNLVQTKIIQQSQHYPQQQTSTYFYQQQNQQIIKNNQTMNIKQSQNLGNAIIQEQHEKKEDMRESLEKLNQQGLEQNKNNQHNFSFTRINNETPSFNNLSAQSKKIPLGIQKNQETLQTQQDIISNQDENINEDSKISKDQDLFIQKQIQIQQNQIRNSQQMKAVKDQSKTNIQQKSFNSNDPSEFLNSNLLNKQDTNYLIKQRKLLDNNNSSINNAIQNNNLHNQYSSNTFRTFQSTQYNPQLNPQNSNL
ncbi:hypothetical protein PPERSA_08020 [Pseudocohnilembus persalinus]|uniref:Uncharacterized protein n=1 Tax=Pseudocohnilembus persalinus TaxID=266149 RepID=A0A0V0R3E7_PSEPJ|nr:hypothetical protein PPERSA_08020 [Pseudocohnilembus persalinus]|eukprot:KRX08709.1 hypothetical protein PPERSA_08020 [Pseudocohnilembus persalinus]